MNNMTFEEYIKHRTQYALDVAKRTGLIDMDGAAIALMQALWAREYWFNKAAALNK